MKQAAIVLVLFGVLMTGSLGARADSGNPFGFETNTHPLEYEYCKKEPGRFRGHGYRCSSAPRPPPDPQEYGLQFVEDVGLCMIVGGSRKLRLPGLDHNNMVQLFKDKIVQKYGPPTKEEIPDLKGAYDHHIYWNSNAGYKGLGDVKGIQLDLELNYHMRIRFWLVTFDTCWQKIEEKSDRAF